jgi:SNF2 family DNA or RNA helicase
VFYGLADNNVQQLTYDSVVFSYWTYTLDLIESLLIESSISYTRVDGQHSGEKREEAIQKFQRDGSIQVILVSITCGGAG